MRDAEGDIARAGGRLAAIGTGDIAYARDFKASRAIGFPLLVDDDRVTYGVVGAGRATVATTLRPSVLAKGTRSLLRGSRQGALGPAALLLGATTVIRPDGRVPLAWRSDDVADTPPVTAILRALAPPGSMAP
ncbi:MAG TPA: AhpC/TSA family protein [Egibacteraceae bacterium]|nr:AhpC/TSA family protein [Egibacteraceae bacterium]